MQDKLKSLIEQLNKYNLDGYIIPSFDEYQNEYVPNYAKRLEYITGFTGSYGVAIITLTSAVFFTDGRYITQSYSELCNETFKIYDISKINTLNWEGLFQSDDKIYYIGYDPNIFTKNKLQIFTNTNKFTLKPILDNLVDNIWHNKPRKLYSKVYAYDEKYTGKSYHEKLQECINFIKNKGAYAMFLCKPDNICWLLNIRSSDVEFTPLFLTRALITLDQIYLFVDDEKLNPLNIDIKKLNFNLVVRSNHDLQNVLNSINDTILIDEQEAPIAILDMLKNSHLKYINNPCVLWQAVKNNIEIENAINIHIKDAVAVCEFLAHITLLESTQQLKNYTEYDIGKLITSYRAKDPSYIMDSFATICGFNENGAVIHYRAKDSSAKYINTDGVLLIDSGGQYLGGTTDITRTIAIGDNISDEVRKNYTNVLKGHIALSKVVFPKEAICSNLDILARQYLWNDYKDYKHGTSHGVGNFLGVHEAPQAINLRNNIMLSEGMILSNEPGFYIPNKYGIRIENMMYVKVKKDNYLCFDTLTLVPYDSKMIDKTILTQDEISYIRKYYDKIHELVYPLLSFEAKKWFISLIHF